MRKVEKTERPYLECDGCQYVIGLTVAERRGGLTTEEMTTTLRIPWQGDFIEFHFHGPEGQRHDCFRYWAHSTHVMKQSLRERDWLEGDIEEFMATHLYREHGFGPGIARPA